MPGDDEGESYIGGSPKPFLPARQTVIVVVAVAIVFGVLFIWRNWLNAAPPPRAPPPTEVVATVIEPTEVPIALDAVGSLRAVRQVILAPEVAGRVTAIHFHGGARVRAGANLVQLYDGPERADRAAAAAKAAFARQQLERSRKLISTGAVSQEALEQSQADYDQAAAAVRLLDARLVQKRITAPFAGQLGLRRIDPGQFLNPGDEIATLTDLDRLFVDFSVPQQDLTKLHIGGAVQVTSDALTGRSFAARVRTIEPRISENSRNIQVRAIMANPAHALRPGMFVNAAIEQPPLQGALVVPSTAIQTSAQGESVIVIRGDNARKEGKADFVAVTTGHRFDDSVVVTSGLKRGEVVVAEGQLRVRPGAKVRVKRLIPATGH